MRRQRGEASPVEVMLVSMPFGPLESPSLGLGLLQSRLTAAGVRTMSRYFTVDYAARIGQAGYRRIVSGFPHTTDLLGEWIFSHAVHVHHPDRERRYLECIFDLEQSFAEGDADALAALAEGVHALADAAGRFADDAAEEVLSHAPRVVGFTTVFQQTLASIAVASRLRTLDPSVRTVVGGPNCEGPMGRALAETYPVFDAVVSGEADLLIVPLVQSWLAGESPQDSPRVQPYLDSTSGAFLQARMVPDLDGYVSPSFDDYFHDLARLEGAEDFQVHLPLETSRGCWWGMKHHCTFCGLNGGTMAFRSRPPDQAADEVVAMSARYPQARISFVDNIMDRHYYATFLPKLAETGLQSSLFYEIKANVTRDEVAILKRAGVDHVQPGIESLSDQVLRIMRKGVRCLQNIQLLKWCREYGIGVDWNILCGFPGEDPEEYERMARLVPLLCHLQPPARCSEIRLDRFSPHFTNADEFGYSNVRPYPAYQDVHVDVAGDAVFDLAYFFEADHPDLRSVAHYTRPLVAAIDTWRAAHASSHLVFIELEGRIAVFDSRALVAGPRVHVLDPIESRIFAACDAARSLTSIVRELSTVSADEVAAGLERMCAAGMMVSDGAHFLSLALALPNFLLSHDKADELRAGLASFAERP